MAEEKTQGNSHENVLARGRERFKFHGEAESHINQDAISDEEFLEGDQWPAEIKQSRTDDNRPMLTINKLPQHVHQITNDQRQNRQDIKVSGVDDKADPDTCQQIKNFIERHEWLGKMPHRPTHRFIATYKGLLAGVVVMATPNSFSHLLGRESRDKEKLISRGACISWSPKNLGSALVMFSIRWMVKNTRYRFFTAYSDTEARELGTIYQACNFIYLGQNSGAREHYFDPNKPEKGWFSDRQFRKAGQIRGYAKEFGICWQESWGRGDQIFWQNVPEDLREKLQSQARRHQALCFKRKLPRKHKYVYILGKTKKETKALKGLFQQLNPKRSNLIYPKNRGPQNTENDAATKKLQTKEGILTKKAKNYRPTGRCDEGHKKLLNVKEVANMFCISQWAIYNLIKSDVNFPFINVGLRKKYLIPLKEFESWLYHRSRNERPPQVEELLKMGGEM